jgi:glutathione S-transferase
MITLFTSHGDTCRKLSITLEELELTYDIKDIEMNHPSAQDEWFTKINPNGHQPSLIDHDNCNFPVFESGAALLYLADRSKRLIPSDAVGRLRAIQWLMWQLGSPTPARGTTPMNVTYSVNESPYVSSIPKPDMHRLFEVLDRRLAECEYLAGDYSVADISTWSWLESLGWATSTEPSWPHLERWSRGIASRPAVKRANRCRRPGLKSAVRHAEPMRLERTG